MSQSPSKTAATLCPIPRDGLGSSAGAFPILSVFLFLSTALMGVGLYTLPSASEGGLPLTDILSGAVILLLTVYLWRITRTARAILPILILAGGFLSVYTGSLLPAALLCGAVFILGAGSLVMAVLPKSKLVWLPLIPLAAYALAAILSRDPLGAAVVLVPWPAAAVLALETRRSAEREDGPNRVGVICATSLVLGLSLTAFGVPILFRALGTLDPTVLAETLEAVREGIIQSFLQYEIPADIDPELEEQWKSLMTHANLRELVNSIFNLLPGIFVAGVLILVAACQAIQHAALRAFGYEESLTDRVKDFRMSLLSCIVFLAAYLLVILENSTVSSLMGTVAQNITFILMPGLALAGMLRATRALVRKGAHGMGCLFFLIVLIPCLMVVAPFALAAVEVIGNIISSVAAALNPPDDDAFDGDPR